ncbi:WD repeat-containing protein 27 [Kryptolebias marmoratus]|uniref:WD repeat-containing protein 27 n=1 Tax=Kryptolebias marmoratus TaxID=37003 RepID=UPI0007F912C7|nr:WD repeat-containing protein 27 [Kryptolebias marmoratus]
MITQKLSLTCDRLLSHQQLACCHSYCGIPFNGKEALIYSNMDPQQKPLLLTGHHGDIGAMTFGKRSRPVLLCSASADYIIVWDIETCQNKTQEGEIATGIVIGTLLGDVVHLSFCFSDERVAACSGSNIHVLSSKRQEVICTLTGHLGPLTSAEFCPWNRNILVSASEDRTFKVWDLETKAVLYQSFVLSASPLLSVLFVEKDGLLITGSADGQLWCFSLGDDHKCHLVTKMDLVKMERRHQGRQKNPSLQAGADEHSAAEKVEISKPVVQMASCGPFIDISTDQKIDSWFCIGSTDGLYVVDLATSELQTVLYFKDNLDLSITMAGSWSLCSGCDNSTVVLVSSLFTPCVVLLEISLSNLQRVREDGEGFSLFPSSAPLPESPLNAELKLKEPNYPKKKGSKEKPLVFHSKVKSSGYTSSPRRIMFSPKINAEKTSSSKKTTKKIGLLHSSYPADSAAPTIPCIDLSIANKQVFCLQYSGDGKQILCGLGDSSVLLYKSSLTGSPTVYIGHDKPVSSVSWSLGRQWWLSSSDLSIRIWTNGSSEPAIIMGDNVFSKPIKSAQFYYLDKFLLLASGPSVYLYLYNVDITRDVIKRYKQRSVVKMASCVPTSSTDITALSAANDFLSYIVLVCGSDRSIQVVDMNKGAVASVLPDAHSRVIHCITQNKGSIFSSQTPESYNLFLTGAVTDGVKIWDLRTLRCVRRYENHANRCQPCSSAISPCGRFIVCGSEDKCAYVYDIRSSTYFHKLQRHSDTVLSVAFNPATPELLTGTLDGKLRLFQSSAGSHLSRDTTAALHCFPSVTV